MEVCWLAMALFKDCLRMSTVADTEEGEVVEAILSITAAAVPPHLRNRGLIRLRQHLRTSCRPQADYSAEKYMLSEG